MRCYKPWRVRLMSPYFGRPPLVASFFGVAASTRRSSCLIALFVRALIWYLDRTKDIRSSTSLLILSEVSFLLPLGIPPLGGWQRLFVRMRRAMPKRMRSEGSRHSELCSQALRLSCCRCGIWSCDSGASSPGFAPAKPVILPVFSAVPVYAY